MGWVDGFAPHLHGLNRASLGAMAFAWPGLREHLESLLGRQEADEEETEETEEEQEA